MYLDVSASGEVQAFLIIDDAMECKDRSASLPYTPADCDALHGVTVALHVRYEDEKLAVENARCTSTTSSAAACSTASATGKPSRRTRAARSSSSHEMTDELSSAGMLLSS